MIVCHFLITPIYTHLNISEPILNISFQISKEVIFLKNLIYLSQSGYILVERYGAGTSAVVSEQI